MNSSTRSAVVLATCFVLVAQIVSARQYPGAIFGGEWVDHKTPLSAANLNARDNEIRAIQLALGLHLVPDWRGRTPDISLSHRLRVTAVEEGGNLLLAEKAGSVGIGTAVPDSRAKLDVAGNLRVRDTLYNDDLLRIRARNGVMQLSDETANSQFKM